MNADLKLVGVLLPKDTYVVLKGLSDTFERPVGYMLRGAVAALFLLNTMGLIDAGGKIDLRKLEATQKDHV